MATRALSIPLIFVTETVASLPTKPPAAIDAERSHMVEVLPDQAVARHVENTGYEIMGLLVVNNKPDCPYDFDSRFLTDLVEHVESFNRQVDVPRDLKKTRFVVVLHVGRGVENYKAASLILDKVVPFAVGFKTFFPCSALVYTGPPVKIRPDYIHDPRSLPKFECLDYWDFFNLKTFVGFVHGELARRKTVSDRNFLLALRTPDVIDFSLKYMLPRSKEYFVWLSREDTFEVANCKQFALFIKFVISRVLASQTDEMSGPQVPLYPVGEAGPSFPPTPPPQQDAIGFELPAVDQDYRCGANIPRKRHRDDERVHRNDNGGRSNAVGGEAHAHSRRERGSDSRQTKNDLLHVSRRDGAIGERVRDRRERSRDRDSRGDERESRSRREERDWRREPNRAPEREGFHSGADSRRRELSRERRDGFRDRRDFDSGRERRRRRSIERVDIPLGISLEPDPRVDFFPPLDPRDEFLHRSFDLDDEPPPRRFRADSGPIDIDPETFFLRNGEIPPEFDGPADFTECERCGLTVPHFELELHLASGECPGLQLELDPRFDRLEEERMVQCRYCKMSVPSAMIGAHIRSPACTRNGGRQQPPEETGPSRSDGAPLPKNMTVCRHCQRVVRKADIGAHIRSSECSKNVPVRQNSNSRDASGGYSEAPLGKNMTVCRHCQKVVSKADIRRHVRSPECESDLPPSRVEEPPAVARRIAPQPARIEVTECRYCHRMVPKGDIRDHLRSLECSRNNPPLPLLMSSPPPLAMNMTQCRYCGQLVYKRDIVEHIRGPDCANRNIEFDFDGDRRPMEPPREPSPPPRQENMITCRYCGKQVPRAEVGAHIRSSGCTRNKPEVGSPRKTLLPHPEPEQRSALLATPEPGPSRRVLLPSPDPEPRPRALLPSPGERASLLPSPGEKPSLLPSPGERPSLLPSPGKKPGLLPIPGDRPGLLPRPEERPALLPDPPAEEPNPAREPRGDLNHLLRDAMETLERMPEGSADAPRIKFLINQLLEGEGR